MQTFAKPVRLRDGSEAVAEVIPGPNLEWADRIEPMLRHKGPPWNWQISALLREELGVDARFHVLHQEGRPFSHVLVVRTGGAGLLGHVWTAPERRGTGACAVLMDLALEEFPAAGGRALYLSAALDSAAWHYYQRRGFELLEERSGHMVRCEGSGFVRDWFNADAAEIEPLHWKHWASSAPLFAGDFPGVVRLSAGGLMGRRTPETPLLTLLQIEAKRKRDDALPCTHVLRAKGGDAVLGLASAIIAPAWPDSRLVDLYCHPDWWGRADELLAALPDERPRSLAYSDANLAPKCQALERAGFRRATVLPSWVARDAAKTGFADVAVYIK